MIVTLIISAFRRVRENAKACCRTCNRDKADMDAVEFQRSRDRTPRCQNIADGYDCENDAISTIRSLLFWINNCLKAHTFSEKSGWLRCTDCYGGGASAGDIALGVGIGVGILGLAAGAAALIHESTKERYDYTFKCVLK